MNQEKLNWDFRYHAPDPERAKKHSEIRFACLALAFQINQAIPDSREKSLAITKLEEVMFWANAAIARQDRPESAALSPQDDHANDKFLDLNQGISDKPLDLNPGVPISLL